MIEKIAGLPLFGDLELDDNSPLVFVIGRCVGVVEVLVHKLKPGCHAARVARLTAKDLHGIVG